MKTFSAKADEVKRDWFLVDADGKTLGRLATEGSNVKTRSVDRGCDARGRARSAG